MEPDAEERIKAAAQAQVIECLNRFYAMETGLWGGPLDALIVRTIIVGDIQGRPMTCRRWPASSIFRCRRSTAGSTIWSSATCWSGAPSVGQSI